LSWLNDPDTSWTGLWTSILNVDKAATSPHIEDFYAQYDESLFGSRPEIRIEEESFEELPALTDVSRRIQTWADVAVPFNATDNINHVENDVPLIPASVRKLEICFGMIHSREARLIGNMPLLRSRLTTMTSINEYIALQLAPGPDFFALTIDENVDVAQLNDSLTEPLRRISNIPSVRLEAFANVETCMHRIDHAKRQHESVIKVDINVYGNADVRGRVGQSLSSDKVYLQHTRYRKEDFEYDNPHMLVYNDIDLEGDFVPEAESDILHSTEPAKMQRAIMDICQSETRERGLKGLKNDIHVRTPLLPHQEQALEFMVQREVGPIPLEFQLWQRAIDKDCFGFRHAVTGCWTTMPSPETGGGILADDMGMGKSLSTLALITRTLSDAWNWSGSKSHEANQGDTANCSSRATLIIVPSLMILNCWLTEIERHLDGTLKVLKYHGHRRDNQIGIIADADIILTTYHTLATERKRRSPLHAINWYRIVLDEAHTIRRQATTLFAAVSELNSSYRWCLTGTPIQNKLEDLGSLLAFIRANPFDRLSIFRKYVIGAFEDDFEEGKKSLSMLLSSVCLRRTHERLHLPPLNEYCHRVNFSYEEWVQYQTTMNSMARALSHGSHKKHSKTPFGMFQIQLQLRILCNHGTFQRPLSWRDEDRQTQREDVMNSMGRHGEVQCSCCHQQTPVFATNCAAGPQSQLCSHVLCNECVIQMSGNPPSMLSPSGCPYCVIQEDAQHSGIHTQKSRTSNPMFQDDGYSSKVSALISHVQENLSLTKR